MLNNTYPACAVILGFALAAGCGATDVESAPPQDDPELAYAAELARQRPLSVTDVHLDKAMAQLCEVNTSFEVDEAEDDSGDVPFSELAECFNFGALKGRSIELFAHAALKHDAFTNYHGDSRVDSVREHLIRNGILAADISIHAEGAIDERPVDERRVNIRVLPRHYH